MQPQFSNRLQTGHAKFPGIIKGKAVSDWLAKLTCPNVSKVLRALLAW
jgi:hypothetical protein